MPFLSLLLASCIFITHCKGRVLLVTPSAVLTGGLMQGDDCAGVVFARAEVWWGGRASGHTESLVQCV